MLTTNNITKRFGATVALDRVDFEAYPGEIHALVGENGAGKTTLMNIIAGRLRQDAGEASLDGNPLSAGSAIAALRAGIAAVNQSPMLFERMTWEENLAFGGFHSKGFDLDAVATGARALAQRLGFALPAPGSLIEERTMAERVRLEVLRALSFEPRVLILDEPTGVLGPAELSSFLDLLKRLKLEGRIIVLITHKIAEAMAVADRITVLRRGTVVERTTPSQTSAENLARTMVGDIPPRLATTSAPKVDGDALTIRNLSLATGGRRILDGISLTLARGEIAGVAGVDGNGQTQLIDILAGISRPDSGEIIALQQTMAVIPENRDLVGLILEMSVWENLMLARPLLERATQRGWLDRTRAIELGDQLMAQFGIRSSGPEAPAGALSGGNRQRLEVARAIAAEPRVIVAHNICRGLDLAGTAEVHRRLAEFAVNGGAVLLISSDLDELLETCNRLFVISRGRIRETTPEERDAQKLGMLMAGNWE